jgi:hypothetical protein
MCEGVVQYLVRGENNTNVVQYRVPHTLLCPMIYIVLAGEYEDIIVRKVTTEDLALLLAQSDSRREKPYTLCQVVRIPVSIQ